MEINNLEKKKLYRIGLQENQREVRRNYFSLYDGSLNSVQDFTGKGMKVIACIDQLTNIETSQLFYEGIQSIFVKDEHALQTNLRHYFFCISGGIASTHQDIRKKLRKIRLLMVETRS